MRGHRVGSEWFGSIAMWWKVDILIVSLSLARHRSRRSRCSFICGAGEFPWVRRSNKRQTLLLREESSPDLDFGPTSFNSFNLILLQSYYVIIFCHHISSHYIIIYIHIWYPHYTSLFADCLITSFERLFIKGKTAAERRHWRRNEDALETHWNRTGDELGTHWRRTGEALEKSSWRKWRPGRWRKNFRN